MDTKRIHGLMLSACCTVIISSGFNQTLNKDVPHARILRLAQIGAHTSWMGNRNLPPTVLSLGPLSNLANRVLVDPGKVEPIDDRIAEIFGFAVNSGIPKVYGRSVEVKDENGSSLGITIEVCVDCRDAIIFGEVYDHWMRLYLTHPDGELMKVYDVKENDPTNWVITIDASVKARFQNHVDFWKKQLNAA